jgi:hypothetical protein
MTILNSSEIYLFSQLTPQRYERHQKAKQRAVKIPQGEAQSKVKEGISWLSSSLQRLSAAIPNQNGL